MIDIKLEKQLPVVQINFEEVKASLIAGSVKYKNLVVTEESLKDCKLMQKELSRTKADLETYRKTIKKEMLVPVTNFENQCKELFDLVVEVENPIKESIAVFDDKVKEAKKVAAQKHINEAIADLQLNEKYAAKLIVLDEYTGLSISAKKVREDIERRSLLLQQEQQQEAENLQIIKDTIENCNKNIDAKMDIEDFRHLIETGTISAILGNINIRAERIKENELKAAAEKAARAEKEVQERIAKAEREAVIKAENLARIERELKEEKEEAERLRLKAIEDAEIKANEKFFIRKEPTVSQEAKYAKEVEREEKPLIEKLKETMTAEADKMLEKRYFIEMRVEGTMEEVVALSKFLKENNYNYKATDKGEIHE